MNQPQIKLANFRKSFNIPSDFIRSTCKILNIEIIRSESELTIPLHNNILQEDNDTIILYAFSESKLTGKIETTKKKEFNADEIHKCSEQTQEKRSEYLLISDLGLATKITKKPREAIDISATSGVDPKREEFVSVLAEVVAKAVSNQSRSVLNTQEELHKAMENKWLLTNEQLGMLLGMSKSTIGSKPDGWRRMGFQYHKIKEGTITLWSISRYTIRNGVDK